MRTPLPEQVHPGGSKKLKGLSKATNPSILKWYRDEEALMFRIVYYNTLG